MSDRTPRTPGGTRRDIPVNGNAHGDGEGDRRQRLTRLSGLVPAGPPRTRAARTPFVLLLVVLLGVGMLGLLYLNTSLNQDSFELSELKQETQELTDEQQELQGDIDSYSAPDALAKRARELGMVPGGAPAFLREDGSVLGDPEPAPSQDEESGR